MKKTIIAAAVAAAVAAPAAFAEVSISGQINAMVEFNDTGDNSMDENSDVVFSGSEDLGNGMKAFFKIATSPDNATAGATTGAQFGEDDRYIGLSGDFGTVMLGRYEQLITSHGTDMANGLASFENLSVEQTSDGGNRGNEGIRYTSPNFNGITVAVGGFMNGTDGEADNTTKDMDTTEAMIQYSNAGLTVRYVDHSSDVAGDDADVLGVSYAMGDLTVAVTKLDSSTNSEDATIVGASYTMGANKIAAAYVYDHKTTATEGDYVITAKHSLSKSTTVGIGHEGDDTGSNSSTGVFVQHKF